MINRFKEYLIKYEKITNTIDSYLRHLQGFFNWYKESFATDFEKFHRANVLDFISFLRNIKKDNAKQDIEAFRQKILEHESKRNYVVITIMAYAGLRISETLDLKISDVDLASKRIDPLCLENLTYSLIYLRVS